MILRCLLAHLLALLCAFSVSAHAKPKTDVVTLYNGDRITGEIKTLEGGILSLSTDAMGTVKIEWQDIARVDSEYYYEFRTSDGARFLGSLQQSKVAGQMKILDPQGEHSFEALQVVTIRPIEKSVLDRLDMYFSAGYSYTRASSISQTTLNTNISYENERSRNYLNGRASFTDSRDENTSSSKVEVQRAVWTPQPGVFRASFGSYESNDELGLDYRVGIGMGRGKYFIDNYRNRLTGIAGLQVITEQTQNSGEDQNLELALNSRYQAWRFNTPELNLDFSLNLFPSITETGRVRGSSDLRLRWELIEDLFWDITAYGSYDNRADTDSDVDYGVTTGIGWEY